MREKLVISKKEAEEQFGTLHIRKSALACLKSLSEETNRPIHDVASRLILWAYDHVEIVEADEEADET